MKNYTLDKEQSQKYIEGYRVTHNEKMIVKYKTGKPKKITHNKENVDNIISIMDSQSFYNNGIKSKIQEISSKVKKANIVYILTLIIIIYLIMIKEPISLLLYFTLIFSGMPYIVHRIIQHIQLKDIEKIEIYKQNELKYKTINKNNKTNLMKVSYRAKRAIKKTNDQIEPPININNIRYMSKKDLERIKENILIQEKIAKMLNDYNQLITFNSQSSDQKGKIKRK